jgi:hypothetical protein
MRWNREKRQISEGSRYMGSSGSSVLKRPFPLVFFQGFPEVPELLEPWNRAA